MGEQNINTLGLREHRANFIRHLLNDIEALELMLEQNLIEDDIVRIGAEQEFCLVDKNWRPARNFEVILQGIDDPHFTTELARFNLEINLDPLELSGDCFSRMKHHLDTYLKKANDIAKKHKSKVVLTGILPTISKNELEIEYMTPKPRYSKLNELLKELRGHDFQLNIRGIDEVTIMHDSVLFEACNTSFQLHLQIPPKDFISSYNWAQTIAGPLLGICTNSPLLMGRELWSETRIALFRQSIDIRSSSYALKDQEPRVKFGSDWETGSIAKIFKDDIAQHKVVLSQDFQMNSLEKLKKGDIPKLPALNLNNGTIYRWNRPCYGVGNGKAHIRIENRYIPSGPSTLDEMANFVFWTGLMIGRPSEYDNMTDLMNFRDVKSNFIKTSKFGKDTILNWMGKTISVQELVESELLPIAHNGLAKAGIDKKDILFFLDVIRKRSKGQTGSEWITRNYRMLRDNVKIDDALRLLTRAMYKNQQKKNPVHEWLPVKRDGYLKEKSHLVAHIMSTQLFTVQENDFANFATTMMKWKNIHHVPVENEDGKLSGLLTWSHAQKFIKEEENHENLIVGDIMQHEIITVGPDTHIKDAIRTMKKRAIGCLPVVYHSDLVGIITIKDIIDFDND